jgi:hypothetical protein
MTDTPDLSTQPDGVREGQHALHGPHLLAALTSIGDLDPVIADVLRNMHLRVYPGHQAEGECNDYIVLDLHGVSIGARRRVSDFYLHVDTTETNDRVIAVEVNGGGEHDLPIR